MDSCDHPVQVAGLCAVCGKTVDDDSSRDRSSSQLHDISGVKVSSAEAARLDSESTRHLLSQRKLALIVDLDQTIIHATVDPTVGDWMKDVRNPNHGALADVGKFFLGVDGKAVVDPAATRDAEGPESKHEEAPVEPQGDGCWYYVKPRPGLPQFLKELSKKFEMHVYTMGTRTYAESVCKLVDPNGSIFGARIISRDENGSLVQKSLKKLFPMDTSMVVIIDDRADVWQWSPNLVRVSPFDFFVGIGDINATFLPKLTATASVAPSSAASSETDDDTTADTALEHTHASSSDSSEASDAGSAQRAQKEREEDDAAKSAAAESQKTAVNEQLDARPLAKMQQALDGQTASQQGDANTRDTESVPSSISSAPDMAAVLREDDRELVRLQNILEDVHERWYSAWQARQREEEEKPAITSIIASIKQMVLQDCNIVFSSVVPLHQDPASTEIWRMAVEFGARCTNAIDARTTHVVAAKAGTEKVLMAQRQGVHAVWCSWLQDSCLHWVRLPEEHYALPFPNRTRPAQQDGITEQGTQDDSTTADSALEDGAGGENASEYGGDGDTDQGFGDMNWDEANDEIDEVLAGLSDEDDEETDAESVSQQAQSASDGQDAPLRSPIKRGRESGSDEATSQSTSAAPPTVNHADGSDLTLSPLSKRRRMTELRAGQSKLKESVSQEGINNAQEGQGVDGAASVPAPRSNAPSEAGQSTGGADEDDFLQSLEAELELQLDGPADTSASQPPTAHGSAAPSPSAVEA